MVTAEELEGCEIRKSCCFFCHQNCGVLAYVKDNKVLKIEGDPDHPTNGGGLCCRGNIALLHLDHPDRINYPLKRKGPKGSGQFERISWEQAISEVAAKLKQIKEESGAEAVATAGGTLRTDDWARRRFMNLYGSPNGFHNSHLCWIPTFMIETAISGWCPFETDLGGGSKCLVQWGHNPAASGMPEIHGISMLQKMGMKLIVIDPKYSETAAKADLWLPVRPGADAALALAWLNVIIYEGLYDQDFVENWTVGFDELSAHVAQYTPEWAAPLTWLDPELIREGARMYATNKPGNIQWGVSMDQSGRPASCGIHARALLRALVGNLDAPGSDLMTGPCLEFVTDEEMEANEYLPAEQKAKQIGSDKYKMTTWPGYTEIANVTREVWGKAPTAEWMCEAHPPSVYRAIVTGKPYQIRGLLISATNPINSYGETKLVLEALRKVEFMICCEYWMTPTAALADYIFPIGGALERPIITSSYGCSDTVVGSERAIQPMYERKLDYDFWRLLGIAMGQAEMWPWETLEDAFYYRICNLGYGSTSYDDFVENQRFHFPEREYFRYTTKGFATPSRKVELYSSIMEKLGYPPMPTYVGPAENEIDNPEIAAKYPLVLSTAGGFMPFHHSEHFQIKELRFLNPEPRFDVHPETAQKYGIEDGDWCYIETQRGRIKQRARVSQGLAPNIVLTQRGWWYPERPATEPELSGCLESNANVLTCSDDSYCDPAGGSWANRGLLCKIYKVSGGN